MPDVFTRSNLELDNDRSRWWLSALAFVCLAAWCAWSCLAHVGVYRSSQRARVERSAHSVQMVAAGRVEKLAVSVGQRVEAGDLLVQLDTDSERLNRLHVVTRRDAALAEIERIEAQIRVQDQLRRDAQRWSEAMVRREQNQIAGAKQTARHSKERAVGLQRAADLDAVPRQQLADAHHQASRDEGTRRDLALGLQVLRRETDLEGSRQEAQANAILRELQASRSQVHLLDVELQRIDVEIAAKQLRSPVAGEVVSVADLRAGAYVEEGTEIAVVVPDSALRAVAWLPLRGTVGWVRPGQAARVRLDDFPWTRWGSVAASVTHVSRESEQGLIRVELDLDPNSTSIPLAHGLPCAVEIAVDRVTPAELVLRAAGQRAGEGTPPPSQQGD